MKTSLRLLLLFTAVALLFAACDRAGLAEAERDIAAGILRLKDRESPPTDIRGWGYETETWKERYAVEKIPVPAHDRAEEKRIDDYNRRMVAEIEKKHGAGVVKKVQDDAMLKLAAEKLREKSPAAPPP